jgi:pilus assembly protein CpaE
MLQLLVSELGVPRERIELLVNRHAAKGALSLKDLTEALPDLPVHTLPNDFSNVSEAVNLGVPLFEGSPDAQSARALIDLASEITGVKTHTRGRIRRAISSIFRG